MTTTTIIELPIILDDSLNKPLYEQLSQSLRDAINSGRLSEGSVLDSTRDLSRKLGISRHTVLRSVDILQSQGYLVYKNGRLTAVSPSGGEENSSNLIDVSPDDETPAAVSNFATQMAHEYSQKKVDSDFLVLPADQLPFKHWKRLMFKRMQAELDDVCQDVSDPFGCEQLRVEVAEYLKRTRSVNCDSDRVVIFHDKLSALDFIAKLLVNPGDRIAVENPGIKQFASLCKAYRGAVCPVDLDDNGLSIEQLAKLLPQPRLTCVTPSQQNPMGISMSVTRRQELLQWAIEKKSMILEDDSDSQFHHGVRPLPSLQGLDASQRSVIYLSSFDKVLSPLIGVCFAVFPSSLMPAVIGMKELLPRNVSRLDQLVLADFLKEGALERHIRRNASVLMRRRNALITALTRALGRRIWIARESAGTHILVKIQTDWVDAALVEAGKSIGLPIHSTMEFYRTNQAAEGQFIISFSNIAESQAASVVERFVQAVNCPHDLPTLNSCD